MCMELNNIEIGRQSQKCGNSNHLDSINLCDDSPNTTQVYKPKFQFIKLISALKIFSIIIIPFIEILPVDREYLLLDRRVYTINQFFNDSVSS
ncbi:hypothetical protein CONCODRAFT_14215 [Conidiobolus coronatus NRRL 28638]|uniref:Uncharacterized protein n=1 Tax=Conidiobolus coronatus (strain ATCC 28846 / CBS 209.66 / NRRL 28638) TaxID=796925 RepID=A0A137NPF1_CONC2|nr:hypothetical protein CONCODRAFT_14215 [Conidiobolus coronatus NRRL 28638]|eukprot:KXN64615.1 hypothetical protein CONCODRAFT_14215 [Conidiobolus coronatus NRRL 28638]